MRKLFKDVLLVLLLALGFVFGSLDVYAETSDTSKWDTNPVEKLTTSDGIDIIPDFTGVKINKKWASIGGTIVLNVVIPENYDKEEVVIATDLIKKKLENNNYTVLFPGDVYYKHNQKVTVKENELLVAIKN